MYCKTDPAPSIDQEINIKQLPKLVDDGPNGVGGATQCLLLRWANNRRVGCLFVWTPHPKHCSIHPKATTHISFKPRQFKV
mmetsp:Transcript_44600/g.79967  ORF Transcript_44600/g.79967 Transcript_44600/m.79967 type:complete len:81 (+) Transcript_44600:461-703(+)